MDKVNPQQNLMNSRHQDLIDQFRDSKQTPKEFITHCLLNKTVSAADALELMTVLKANVLTRSFSLADLSDEDFYRLGLYEVAVEDIENNPLFVIQFNDSMREHNSEIGELLEDFSRSLAEIVARHEVDNKVEIVSDSPAVKQEAMQTILDTLSTDSVRH